MVLAKEYIEKLSFSLVSDEEKMFLICPRKGIPRETKLQIGQRWRKDVLIVPRKGKPRETKLLIGQQ